MEFWKLESEIKGLLWLGSGKAFLHSFQTAAFSLDAHITDRTRGKKRLSGRELEMFLFMGLRLYLIGALPV